MAKTENQILHEVRRYLHSNLAMVDKVTGTLGEPDDEFTTRDKRQLKAKRRDAEIRIISMLRWYFKRIGVTALPPAYRDSDPDVDDIINDPDV